MSDDRFILPGQLPLPSSLDLLARSSLGNKGPFCGFQKKQQEEMGIG